MYKLKLFSFVCSMQISVAINSASPHPTSPCPGSPSSMSPEEYIKRLTQQKTSFEWYQRQSQTSPKPPRSADSASFSGGLFDGLPERKSK